MKEVKLEEINLWWEGPFKIKDILENKIKSRYHNEADRKGIYQIYGIHPLYGNDKLLYIGRTTEGSFKDRLKDRWQIMNGHDDENIRIYLGTCLPDTKEITDNEDALIIKAEVLLINTMKPAFNSSNVDNPTPGLEKENYILYNHNNHRDIYPILSSRYAWGDEKELFQ